MFYICYDRIYLLFKDLIIIDYTIAAMLMVGLNGLEPSTSRLSGVRSNQLSYRPIKLIIFRRKIPSKLNMMSV